MIAGGEADREAAERRRPEPVHAADDDADEHDDRLAQREVRPDERVLHGHQHRDRRGQQAPRGRRRSRSRGSRARRAAAPSGSRSRRRACAGRSSSAPAAARAAQEHAPRRRPRRRSPCGRRRRADRDPWFSGATDDATSPIVSSRRSMQQRDRLEHEGDREGRDEHHRAATASRSGRKTTRSIAIDIAMHRRAKHVRTLQTTGHDRRVRERVGAGHDQLAVGEVDQPQHAEDEADADRHQRVDRAERRSRRPASAVDQREIIR